jgi:hypothetical protein
MDARFSEFSYGFSLTQELVSEYSYLLTAAPTFPSLIEEGNTGGGYDVNIALSGFPLFLQFKLSEYMMRSNASEASLLGVPYYRFKLRPLKYSDQHKLLVDLEALGNFVYYVAPIFYEVADLNTAFFSRNVTARSIFISPLDIGTLPDDEGHCVVFSASSSDAYFCSRPITLKMHIYGRGFAQALKIRMSNQQPFNMDGQFFATLADQMIGIIKAERAFLNTDLINAQRRQLNPVLFVSYLSRTFFDCEFLILRA